MKIRLIKWVVIFHPRISSSLSSSSSFIIVPITNTKTLYSRTLATTTTTANNTKTFSNQSKLPRLPIPSLEDSISKYLASYEPFHPKGSQEYSKLEEIINEFKSPDGLGTELQHRLFKYEKTQQNSWLEEIWLKYAYLMWRYPSMINVNWWCQFRDHPGQPQDLLAKPPPKGVLSAFQVQRAAGLISNALNFKETIDNETLPIDYIKGKNDTKQLICMNQYRNQFGATRMPGETIDVIHTKHPAPGKHIIVMCKDQMYCVPVYTNARERVPIKEIMRQLFAVGQKSIEDASQPQIGVLTAGDRDVWFKAYKKLLMLSEENKKNFDTIQKALFIVCLDDYSTKKNIDYSHHQIFHGLDCHNRYFDKAIQIVLANTGRAGVNGEVFDGNFDLVLVFFYVDALKSI